MTGLFAWISLAALSRTFFKLVFQRVLATFHIDMVVYLLTLCTLHDGGNDCSDKNIRKQFQIYNTITMNA